LAGSASHDANSNLVVAPFAFKELGNDVLPQRFEGLRIPEELSHSDQEILKKQRGLFRLVAQSLDILLDRVDPENLHAALNAPGDGALFVLAKIVAGLAPKDSGNLGKVNSDLTADAVRLAIERPYVNGVFHQLGRHVFDRQYLIDQTG